MRNMIQLFCDMSTQFCQISHKVSVPEELIKGAVMIIQAVVDRSA